MAEAMIVATVVLPLVGGPLLWVVARMPAVQRALPRRAALALGAGAMMVLTSLAAVITAVTRPTAGYRWGAGLRITLGVDGPAAVATVVVAVVALVVIVFAAHHESDRGLPRLIATLVFFTGAMELLVLGADLLTLLVAWELVGACSWALIAHEWRHSSTALAANEAFVVTHLGDLGLFAAIGAALAGTGGLAYSGLGELSGGWLTVFAVGVVLAAASKSAQVPFSPWLFSAMAGPTSVSALLHAATMVAAGAYLLIRFEPVLAASGWAPELITGIGVVTALAGAVVALLQTHPKRLLTASTSAHYGFMFVAVGAGYPAAALAHLVAHAAFKAPLFLATGVAMHATDSTDLQAMRLGRALPGLAALTGCCALALAAVPPTGGAWTKETVVSAAGNDAAWLAVAVAIAGGLGAAYAARFWILGFGRTPVHTGNDGDNTGNDGDNTGNDGDNDAADERRLVSRPGVVETSAIAVGAVVSLALGVLWLPSASDVVTDLAGSPLPEGTAWELVVSIGLVALGIYGAVVVHRGQLRGELQRPLRASAAPLADWFAIPTLTRAAVTDPTIALCRSLSTFDDRVVDAPPRFVALMGRTLSSGISAADGRVVDAGVRGVARLGRWLAEFSTSITERGFEGIVTGIARTIGEAGSDTRRHHSGLAHQYYVVLVAGVAALVAIMLVAR